MKFIGILVAVIIPFTNINTDAYADYQYERRIEECRGGTDPENWLNGLSEWVCSELLE